MSPIRPAQFLLLMKRKRRTGGLETLSIMYSLPYALLMWGCVAASLWHCSVFHSYISSSMITFVLAFSIMCFQNTSALARFIVGVAWILNAALVAWCICTSWETENLWWSLYKDIWKKFVEGAHSLVPVRCKASDSHESVCDDERASVVESTLSGWFRRLKLKPRSSQAAV